MEQFLNARRISGEGWGLSGKRANSFVRQCLWHRTTFTVQRTTINRRLLHGTFAAFQQRNNGSLTFVIADMAAARSDATVKKQLSLRIVKNHGTGSLRAELFCRCSIHVFMNRQTGDSGSRFPQSGVRPVRRKIFRPKKNDVRRSFFSALRDQLVQFLHAGARAGTLRMREHDQCVAVRIQSHDSLRRPLTRNFSGSARPAFIIHDDGHACCCGQQPRDACENLYGEKFLHLAAKSKNGRKFRWW